MKYIKEIKQTETNKYKLKIRKHYLKDKQILNLIHQDFYNINSVEIIKKDEGFKYVEIEIGQGENINYIKNLIKGYIKLNMKDKIGNNDILNYGHNSR